jgi:xylulose-5-phosphate/fructose-6-phosphate phosphoketolase
VLAREFTRVHGDDIPEVRDWVWPDAPGSRIDTNVRATLTGGDNE